MEDPFSILVKSLQSVFHLESRRHGKYPYPAVQQLKEAVEDYKPEEKNTFIRLLKAIKESLPHIEKWRINFSAIRKSMDELAKLHHMPTINWTMVLSHPKVSSRFQFSALNHSIKEADLTSWITNKMGKSYFQLTPGEVTQTLIENTDNQGFSQKLSRHLKKNPEFLFHLILDTENNFNKICRSRLILYLTDQQIAQAIIKHIPVFIGNTTYTFDQVDQLIHTLNEILSNGRSVSTLLRNAEAAPILLNSVFFQLYQSESYKTHQATPVDTSENYPKNELSR